MGTQHKRRGYCGGHHEYSELLAAAISRFDYLSGELKIRQEATRLTAVQLRPGASAEVIGRFQAAANAEQISAEERLKALGRLTSLIVIFPQEPDGDCQ